MKKDRLRYLAATASFSTLLLLSLFYPGVSLSSDDYSFDLAEFEKKNFAWGGYVEVKYERMDINNGAAGALLNYHLAPRSNLEKFTSTLQIEGNLNKGMVDFNWLLQANAQQDQTGWYDNADIYSAYASIKPTPLATIDLGKKMFKWGKGYAWNPVGFIDRPKDPNNPEEALEGYIGAGLDLIRSFSGSLQTAALTTVLLPVWQEVNEDFGQENNLNLAAKLYLLYRDTDIDFIWFTGNSRSTRYGMDFSRNMASNFEIHAEFAHVPEQTAQVLAEDGSVYKREFPQTSYLLGSRYLSENDITTIVEYYHNDAGFSKTELFRYFQLLTDAQSQFDTTGAETLFQKASSLAQIGYSKPQAGRNYLYAKVTQKEPFDLLCFTLGITSIFNLDDSSYSITPETVYTGFTNWEMLLRFSLLNGGYFTEYGEKVNSNKVEFRLRYFF